jgi:hypothetical protein
MFDSSFVHLPEDKPKYQTNTRVWYVENIDDDTPFDSVIGTETSL